MGTVLRKDGFNVRIYPNDHLPSHVHVIKGNGEAKINLGSEIESPSPIAIWKLSDKEAIKALKIVTDNQKELLEKWREIHG